MLSFAAVSTTATLCCTVCQTAVFGLRSSRSRTPPHVTGTRRCDHISPVLRQLHWLPVRRLQGCMSDAPVAIAGLTPAYLADDVRLVTDTDRRPLRSAAVRTCYVPRTRNSFSDRSFSAAGPRVWNSLPPHLRQDMNPTFKFVPAPPGDGAFF